MLNFHQENRIFMTKEEKISTDNTENISNVYLQLLTNKMLKEISIIVIGYEIKRNYTV